MDAQTLLDLVVDRNRGGRLDGYGQGVADWLLYRARVVLAPDSERKVTVVDIRDGALACVALVEHRALPDGSVGGLIRKALDTERDNWFLDWGRFKFDATIPVVTGADRGKPRNG